MNELFVVKWATTGKEVTREDMREIALHHEWAKYLIYASMDCFCLDPEGAVLLTDKCGNYAYAPVDLFTVAMMKYPP